MPHLPGFLFLQRLIVAAFLGGLLGFERELKARAAGLRTHILVGVGACLFALCGSYGIPLDQAVAGSATRVDLSRVASQIVVGIGFLGGGVILRHGDHVRGLTTAASLWVAAALGLACGLGFYLAAFCAAGVAILALVLLKPLERHLQQVAAKLREKDPDDTDDQT